MPDNNIIDATIDRLIEAATEFGEYDTVPNRFKLRDAKSEVIALFNAQKQEVDRLRTLAVELAERYARDACRAVTLSPPTDCHICSYRGNCNVPALLARPDVKALREGEVQS